MTERTRSEWYQSHECEGFRAKITIEWSTPEYLALDELPESRRGPAEELAGKILAYAAPKVRDMVHAMRGYGEYASGAKEEK